MLDAWATVPYPINDRAILQAGFLLGTCLGGTQKIDDDDQDIEDIDGELDYGYTLIIKHIINNVSLFALYGHLGKSSIENKKIGEHVLKNDKIGFVGSKTENGGWPPHLHFQLSLVEPKECDLPGVVSDLNKEIALKAFPDPRLVLGNLY